MATGSGYTRREHTSLSAPDRRLDNRHQPQNRNTSYNRQDSNDPEELTLRLVDAFKVKLRNKIKSVGTINEPLVEMEIANIKVEEDEDRYNVKEWKKRLPQNLRNCSDNVLRASMAYGNEPGQVETVLQAKMNQNNSDENSADTSLDKLIGPLTKLKKDLDKNPLNNLLRAVRSIDDRENDRAARLFISEAHHLVSNLEDYTFDDAECVVEAIRESNYESDKTDLLLPLIKTCRDTNDIQGYLEHLEQESTKQSKPLKKASSITKSADNFTDDDDDDNTSSSKLTNRQSPNNQNENSTFRYKPIPDPHHYSSQTADRSPRGNDSRANKGHSRHRSPSE